MRTFAFLLALTATTALAQPAPSPFAECDDAIAAATKPPARVPDKLVPAIARVESGRLDAATGRVRPWPWTINVEGTGSFFDSKAQVVSVVQALQARGVRSIDVGCMQVNLMHHPKAFAGLDEAFDPAANARYAVRFLSGLHAQTRDWNLATALYHSAVPDRGEAYQRLVFGRVLAPMGAGPGRTAGPYATWPPTGMQYGAIPPVNFAFGAFATPKPISTGFGWQVAPGPVVGRLIAAPHRGAPAQPSRR